MTSSMAYSVHGHISYILEINSKRTNGFSLIGRKPNDFLQFKWKRLMVLTCKPNEIQNSSWRGVKQ